MHDYILALVLGIVEGLTEFLPVSSTAHLRICQSLLGIALDDGYWKMFAIVIQLGAILTLPIYFRQRIKKFLATFPHGERGDRTTLTHPLTLVAIAFVCTAAPAFLLTKVIGKHLESLRIMGAALVIGGIVMWIIDALYVRGSLGTTTNHVEEMSLGQAVWIGLCQTLSALSRNLALHVHHRRWTTRGHVPPGCPGVFLFPLHSNHGRGHVLRPVQEPAPA